VDDVRRRSLVGRGGRGEKQRSLISKKEARVLILFLFLFLFFFIPAELDLRRIWLRHSEFAGGAGTFA